MFSIYLFWFAFINSFLLRYWHPFEWLYRILRTISYRFCPCPVCYLISQRKENERYLRIANDNSFPNGQFNTGNQLTLNAFWQPSNLFQKIPTLSNFSLNEKYSSSGPEEMAPTQTLKIGTSSEFSPREGNQNESYGSNQISTMKKKSISGSSFMVNNLIGESTVHSNSDVSSQPPPNQFCFPMYPNIPSTPFGQFPLSYPNYQFAQPNFPPFNQLFSSPDFMRQNPTINNFQCSTIPALQNQLCGEKNNFLHLLWKLSCFNRVLRDNIIPYRESK